MKYTSAEAAKLLRQLNDRLYQLEQFEEQCKEFLAALGEDADSVRPDYDFGSTQKEIYALHKKIRNVKHALNVFNSVTVVKEFNMTIDEMLVYIPQLTNQKAKLGNMIGRLPKTREAAYASRGTNVIDYRYLNYDPNEAQKEYDRIADILSKAQTALDVTNNTVKLEIDV